MSNSKLSDRNKDDSNSSQKDLVWYDDKLNG